MKTILDKINKADEIQAKKTELGTHEVELGSVADLEKYNKDSLGFNSLYGKVVANYNKLEQEKKKLADNVLDLNRQINKLNEIGQRNYIDFSNKAKELGIDPNTSKAYKDAELTFDKNTKLITDLIKLRNSLGAGDVLFA